MTTPLPALDEIFFPKSAAVIGVSADLNRWNAGRSFFESMKATFKGKLYAVGLQGGEVYGYPVYKSLKDVPGTVDYVISAIPAAGILGLIEDAKAKKVKAIHLFTAGFSETGRKDNTDMEMRIVAAARQANLRIIGPNGMGIYCPAGGLAFRPTFSQIPGRVGLMCQSGGNTDFAIRETTSRGLYISRGISFGNATDVNEAEILEYYARDKDTDIVLMYIEGVRDGLRFKKALADAVRQKPVIIYKSGLTAEGARAAVSHTASIAGNSAVWDALIKQTGALRVYSIEELADIADLQVHLPNLTGSRVAIMGVGGGQAVLASDECAKAGLKLPLLSAGFQTRMNAIMGNDVGASYRNPVDIHAGLTRDQAVGAFREMSSTDEVDVTFLQMEVTWISEESRYLGQWLSYVSSMQAEMQGRFVIVIHHATATTIELGKKLTETFREAGFPVFPSVTRAATAVSRFSAMKKNRAELIAAFTSSPLEGED